MVAHENCSVLEAGQENLEFKASLGWESQKTTKKLVFCHTSHTSSPQILHTSDEYCDNMGHSHRPEVLLHTGLDSFLQMLS